jgi:hypothetical protein
VTQTHPKLLRMERTLLGVALLSMPFVLIATVSLPGKESMGFRFTPAELILALYAIIHVRKVGTRIFATPHAVLIAILALGYILSSLAHPSSSAFAKCLQFLVTLYVPYLVLRNVLTDYNEEYFISRMFALAVLLAVIIAGCQLGWGVSDYFVRGGLPNSQVYSMFLLIAFPFLLLEIVGMFQSKDRIGLLLIGLTTLLVSITIRDTGHLAALMLEMLIMVGCFKKSALRYPVVLASCLLASLLHVGVHKDATVRFSSLHEVADIQGAYEYRSWLSQAETEAQIKVGSDHRNLEIGMPLLSMNPKDAVNLDLNIDRNLLKQRYVEWIAAARMMGANPTLGVGPDNYQRNIGEFYSPMQKLNISEPYCQNGWLVLGSSIGLVGMLALMLAMHFAIVGDKLSVITENPDFKDDRMFRIAIISACCGTFAGAFWSPLLQSGTLVPLAALMAIADKFVDRGELEIPRLILEPVNFKGRLIGILISALGMAFLFPNMVHKENSDPVYLWREAEEAESITKPCVISNDTDASNHAGIAIYEGSGTGWRGEAGGNAIYTFDLPVKGIYNLWARTRWSDGCGNAFFASINKQKRLLLGNDSVFHEWHWIKLSNLKMNRGINHLEIANREDGVELDKLLLTNDSSFQPRGKWEVVFSRDLSKKRLIGWDIPDSSLWKNIKKDDHRGLHFPFGESESSPILITSNINSDFHLESTFRFLHPDSDIEFRFLATDALNYYALDIKKAIIVLRLIKEGKSEILSKKDIDTISMNDNHQAEVLFRNGIISILLDAIPFFEQIDRRLSEGRCGFASNSGGAVVETFDVRPLTDIYYMYEVTDNEALNDTMTIGEIDWSNYSIALTLRNSSIPLNIKYNINRIGNSFINISLDTNSLTIASVVKNVTIEEKVFSLDTATSSSTENLIIRSIEYEVSVLLDDKEIAGAKLSERSSLKGSIKISKNDITRVVVKQLCRFFDGFGGCDGNNSASWELHGGNWKVVTDAMQGLQDSFVQYGDKGVAIALTGETFWRDYDIRCMLRSSGGNGIGVILYYQDEDNYDLLRWAQENSTLSYAGRLEYVRRKRGVDTIIDGVGMPCDNDRWYVLRTSNSEIGRIISIDNEEMLEVSKERKSHGLIGLFAQDNPGAYFDNVTVDFY